MENSNKIKILSAVGIGLMLIVVSCLFGATAKNAWGSATDIIKFSDLSEEQQTALCESLELDLFETEQPANLTRLIHPGKDGFIEYRLSINTTGRVPFLVRNPFIAEYFTEYDPTAVTISAIKRGFYFREDKIYICAVYSNGLPFTYTADRIFEEIKGVSAQTTEEAA